MFLPKIREIKEALVSLFSKPYTSKFPLEEYKAPEEFRGWPKYHEDFCVGCGTCTERCFFQAITLDDESGEIQVAIDKCIGCGLCTLTCPEETLKLYRHERSVPQETSQKLLETVARENREE